MNTYMHKYIRTYIHVHARIHTCTHTHTRIHIHARNLGLERDDGGSKFGVIAFLFVSLFSVTHFFFEV